MTAVTDPSMPAALEQTPALMKALAWASDVEAARTGDRQALERVLARSRQDLRRYAEFHCVVNDIEDAVQESLIAASRHLMDLRQVECFASWLFRIVKRECNRLKRGLRRLRHEPITEDIAECPASARPALACDLAVVLESLPAHYREILLLRDVEGLSLAELGERLALSEQATKARLHRARAMARRRLLA